MSETETPKTIVAEVMAVARLIVRRAGWDPDEPEDDTEEDIKHIYAEAAEHVEAARLVREGIEPAEAVRKAENVPEALKRERAIIWNLKVDGMNERGLIDGGVTEQLHDLNPWRHRSTEGTKP